MTDNTVSASARGAYPQRTIFAAASAVTVVAVGAVQSLQGDQDNGYLQWLIVSAIGLVAIGVVLWGVLPRVRPTSRAAVVFAELRARAPDGPFAADALAREAEAWSRAGKRAEARARALEYLRLYPDGNRAAAVRGFGGIE